MTILAGKGTGNVTSTRRKLDVPDKVFFLQPDASPLVQILFKAKKKTTVNPKFTWFERDLFPARDQVNDSKTMTTTNTTFTVDNGDYFKADDIIKIEDTGEQMLVTSVSGDVLTVVRGFGTTSAVAFDDDDYILRLGTADEEGADTPAVQSETASEVYNYVQDFRTPFELTDILQNSDMWGGKDLKNERVIKAIEHKTDMERAFLFGERKLYTSGTHYRRSTAGVISRISTNVTTATTLTETAWESFLESAFDYGSDTKVFLASGTIMSAVSSWGRGKLNTVPKDKTYGINVREYISPHGRVMLVRHKLLKNTTGANYAGYGIMLDMNDMLVRVMKGLDTKLLTNRQGNGETKLKEEYRTVAGTMLINEKKHAVLKGVTAYS